VSTHCPAQMVSEHGLPEELLDEPPVEEPPAEAPPVEELEAPPVEELDAALVAAPPIEELVEALPVEEATLVELPAPPEPVPQPSQVPNLMPSGLQACAPCSPCGHAQASCFPGRHVCICPLPATSGELPCAHPWPPDRAIPPNDAATRRAQRRPFIRCTSIRLTHRCRTPRRGMAQPSMHTRPWHRSSGGGGSWGRRVRGAGEKRAKKLNARGPRCNEALLPKSASRPDVRGGWRMSTARRRGRMATASPSTSSGT